MATYEYGIRLRRLKNNLLPEEHRGMIINETGTAVHRVLEKNEKKKDTRVIEKK